MSFAIFEDENGVKHRVHISTLYFGKPQDCNANSTIKKTTMNQDQPLREMRELQYCARCAEKTTHEIYELQPTGLLTQFERKLEGQCKVCGTTLSQSAEIERKKILEHPLIVHLGDKTFINAVREMRQLQREFFKDTRNMDVLSQAKAAEKRVDALIADMDSPQEKLL